MNKNIINNFSNFSHASIDGDYYYFHFSNKNGKVSSFNKNPIVSHSVAKKTKNSLWFFEQKSIYKDFFSQYLNKAISQDQLSLVTNELIENFRNKILLEKIDEYDRNLQSFLRIYNKFESRKIKYLKEDISFNGPQWKKNILQPLYEIEKDYILRMDSARFMKFLDIKNGFFKIQEGYIVYKNFLKIKEAIVKKSEQLLVESKHKFLKDQLDQMDFLIQDLSSFELYSLEHKINPKDILNAATKNNLSTFLCYGEKV